MSEQTRPQGYWSPPPSGAPPHPVNYMPAGHEPPVPPAPPRASAPTWAKVAIGSLIVVVVALAAMMGVGFSYLMSVKHTAATGATEISQLQKQMSSTSFTEHNDYTTLNGKIIGLNQSLAPVLTYSTVCTQDLTGASGPAAYYFMCTNTKP